MARQGQMYSLIHQQSKAEFALWTTSVLLLYCYALLLFAYLAYSGLFPSPFWSGICTKQWLGMLENICGVFMFICIPDIIIIVHYY